MTLQREQSAPTGSPRRMTNEEFFAFVERPENKDVIFQLFDGLVYPPITEGIPLPMPAPSPLHNYILGRLYFFIVGFLIQRQIGGAAFTENVDYVLTPGTVVQADVSYVAAERLNLGVKRFEFAPDLAVEVKSPGNEPIEMFDKVETYLRYGSRMVWVLYPKEKIVRIFTPAPAGYHVEIRTEADTLTGGNILPGFSVPVADLFPPDDLFEKETA